MKKLLLALPLLLLTACVTPEAQQSLDALGAANQAGDLQKSIEIIKQWKKTDLLAAQQRALAAQPQDLIAANCFGTLAKYTDFGGTLGGSAKFAGFWDALEAGRLALRAGNGGITTNPVVQDLMIGCSPLVMDFQVMIGRLAIMGAGAMLK